MALASTRGSDLTNVFVIDPRPQDYVPLAVECAAGGFAFQFAASGSDALKLRRSTVRNVWLINVHLPDGSGCDLAAAIRARDPHSVVYLVGDQYDPAEELAARMASGSMYVCKPVDSDWLAVAGLPLRMLSRCA